MKRHRLRFAKKCVCMATLIIFTLSVVLEPVLAYERSDVQDTDNGETMISEEEISNDEISTESADPAANTAEGGEEVTLPSHPQIKLDLVQKNETQEPTEEESAAVQAAESSANSWRYENGYIREDAEKYGMMRITGSTPWSKNKDGQYLSSDGSVISGAIKKGIDVSYAQGKIDWAKVKAAGIDFAIIRCGYGSDIKSQDDSWFKTNVEGCRANGIPYGVYLYSYANSESKAKSEASHTLRMLNSVSYKPSYPVYYDLEDNTIQKSKTQKYAEIYCSAIENAGYRAGIYANLDWWRTRLSGSSLDKYEKWVAQWNTKCTYEKNYRLWQSTSSGSVSGIKGAVDIDFEFQRDDTAYYMGGWIKNEKGQYVFKNPNGSIAKSKWINYKGNKYYVNASSVRVTGIQSIGSAKYYFNSSGVLQTGKWLTISKKKYYAQSSGAFATGYKKIGSYYYGFNSSGVMLTGTAKISGKQYKFMSNGKAYLYTAKTKEALNYRKGPGTKYKKKGTYKKNKVLTVIREKSGWGELTNGYWIKLSYTKKVTKYPIAAKSKSSSSKSKSSSYKVKIKTALNYRTGPGTKYKKKGTYRKGKIVTIKSKKNGWGKMSNGYWIKLSYTKKV